MTELKKGFKHTSANGRQVGGDHYQTGGTQHWDMFGPESMMYAATKYVSRWRKKNGVQDLEKSLHYSEKLLEIVSRTNVERPKLPTDAAAVDEWAPNQGITWVETIIIKRLMFWNRPHDIVEAINGIHHLIATAQPKATPLEVVTKEPPGFNIGDGHIAVGDQALYGLNRVLVEVMDVLQDGEADVKFPDGAHQTVKWTMLLPYRPGDTMDDRRVPRRDADESRHASLFPWYMTRTQANDAFASIWETAQHFYKSMGTNGGLILETYVQHRDLPRGLQPCYNLMVPEAGASYWLINIKSVPAELREQYPRLHMELNMKEMDERPRWQKMLYKWHADENKFRLLDSQLAWGPEL